MANTEQYTSIEALEKLENEANAELDAITDDQAAEASRLLPY